MKIISNTVDFDVYEWEDPGDYPNAVASGPLPSYAVCECSGEVTMQLESDAEMEGVATIEDWFDDWIEASREIEVPYGWRIKWKFEMEGNTLTVTPESSEFDETSLND
jgi:hypothetical protein